MRRLFPAPDPVRRKVSRKAPYHVKKVTDSIVYVNGKNTENLLQLEKFA
jgi:hypothetical protein